MVGAPGIHHVTKDTACIRARRPTGITGMTTQRHSQNASSTIGSRPRRRLGPVLIVATALVALVAAACGDDASGADTIGTIEVAAPADGATVGRSFDLRVDTDAPIGEPDTGRQHLHVYYDVDPGAEDYDIVYSLPFTTRDLAPGEHTIRVVVANSDHSITDVRDTFRVTVEPDSGDGGSSEQPAPPDSSDDSGSLPGY
jgi:hypothetical protein